MKLAAPISYRLIYHSDSISRDEAQDNDSDLSTVPSNSHGKVSNNDGRASNFPAQQSIPRIVIADDEPQIARLFNIFLTRAGFKVARSFSNGRELIDFIENAKTIDGGEMALPDVVILDYKMPVLDGIETAKLLRSAHPKIKLILVTAYELPKESSGYFDAYLNKPASANQLLNVVSSVLGS